MITQYYYRYGGWLCQFLNYQNYYLHVTVIMKEAFTVLLMSHFARVVVSKHLKSFLISHKAAEIHITMSELNGSLVEY